MMNSKTRKTIFSAVIAGGVALSLGGIAFAETLANTEGTPKTEHRAGMGKGGFFKGQKGPINENGTAFKSFVEDGTLSKEQSDKITEFMKKKAEEKKAEFDKMKDMTKEERAELLKQKPKERTDMVNELVTAGIISQDQADKIKAKLPRGDKDMHNKGFGKGGFKGNKSGVQSGTKTAQ
jgi:polyhydroxyalkanoate synthesis regulator phasin